ncbi:glycosyltransferase, partial [Planococcus sp. APC 3900]|uniref:glycosyltransferase family 2 protein n=1 Tax=Planococcus sp. APC 3900 TaxID=3035191 RepID=UPI0025B5AC34
MRKLSFIIVNYNTKIVTEECIDSIFGNRSLKKLNYEVIVVDNDSYDDSVCYLEKKFSDKVNFKIIASTENLGFGKANNSGAYTSTGDILVFLNSDTIVKDTNFEKLTSLLADNIGFL